MEEDVITDEQVDEFFESGGEAPEAAPEAEAAPEEQQAEDRPPKMVTIDALHQERERRKELQQQVESTAQRTAQMEEAFRKLVERAQQQQEPSFDEDPINALRAENQKMSQRLAQYDQRFQMSDAQQQALMQQQQFVQNYQHQAAEYAKTNADFQDAYQHLVNVRQAELQSIGYSPQEAAQMLIQEESMIVGKCFQDGANPAERMFELAKMRGWTKGEAPDSKGAEKMDALEKGARAAKSLAGGGVEKANVSLETLASLSDDEFDAAWEKLIGPSA